jgi:glycosyltransferase involved in cell wall biosynthesis
LEKTNDGTVIFYGSIGAKKKDIIGGGESGNRKTVAILKELQFNVIIVEKPYPLKTPVLRNIIYPFQLFLSIIHFCVLLIKTKGKKSSHIIGFYNYLIYFEYLLVILSRCLRVNPVYEIRAGGMIEAYKSGTFIYRMFFKATIKNSNKVLCQGKEYVSFLNTLTVNKFYYYPNYVLNEDLDNYNSNLRELENDIRLVYFGRITPSKNIEFIIEICHILRNKNIGFSLEIIGGGEIGYRNSLIKLIDNYNLANYIKITPPTAHKQLVEILKQKHFFIFPTVEKREGHSNSLTEAMSVGVVPIASDIGFNSSVISEKQLIVERFDPELYAKKVLQIWNDKSWPSFSIDVYNNVCRNFTENIVSKTIFEVHS